jgi:hypothetical protein
VVDEQQRDQAGHLGVAGQQQVQHPGQVERARVIRAAMVASDTSGALATSGVAIPQINRSVSAT